MPDNAPSATTRSAVQALALHPGPQFGLDAAAAALSVPVEEAARLLDALVTQGLLVEVSPLRYQLADRQHSRTRPLPGNDPHRRDTVRRIIDWYQVTATAAEQAVTAYRIRPHAVPAHLSAGVGRLATWSQAVDWLEAERVNLVAAVHAAAGDMPDVAFSLADTMWPLFRLGGHYPDRLEVDRVALDCARRLDSPDLHLAASQRAAEGLCDAGRFGQATRLLQACLHAGERGGDTHRIAPALGGLTAVALARGDLDVAERHARRAVNVSKASGSTRHRVLALLVLGQVYRASGRPALALAHVRDAQRLLQTLTRVDPRTRRRVLPDPYTTVRLEVEHGLALSGDGKHQQAAGLLAKALTAMTALHARRGQAIAQHALGQVTAASGNHTAARRHLLDALEVSTALGDHEAAAARQLLRQLPPGKDTL
ncbi:tetratricopeptide repeat protein [Actinomycetes bacterium KLBMP 9797]